MEQKLSRWAAQNCAFLNKNNRWDDWECRKNGGWGHSINPLCERHRFGQKNNINKTSWALLFRASMPTISSGFLPLKTTSIAKQTRTPTLTTTPVLTTLQPRRQPENHGTMLSTLQPRRQPGDHGPIRCLIQIGIGVRRKLMKYIGKNDYKAWWGGVQKILNFLALLSPGALFSRHKAKNSVFGTAGN